MRCKKLFFPEKQKCEIEEYELPSLTNSQILIKTTRSLISTGTELAMFNRIHRGFDDPDNKFAKYPFYPGYALTGKVVDAGKNENGIKNNDRVFCCGTHADYCIANAADCTRISDEINDSSAMFLIMTEIAMTSIRMAPVEFGSNVVISGMGVVGNLCAQLYALSGAGHVAGADINSFRLDIAKRCGIGLLFDVSKASLKECVASHLASKADIVVEAVGLNPSLESCFKAVSKSGTLVLLGSPRNLLNIDPYNDIHSKAIKVIGAHGGFKDPKYRLLDRQIIIALLNSDKLKTAPFLSENILFENAADGYKKLSDCPEQYMAISLRYE